MKPAQLAFSLPARETLRREAFFVSPANALALATIEDWQAWPLGRMVLAGPPRSGKTHLAHIWADLSGAVIVAAPALAGTDLHRLSAGPVAVEGASQVAGDAVAEEALFHLMNLMAGAGSALLLTADTGPRDWGLALPDLASRVQAAGLVRLDPPDDALLAAVLVKLFADRQITVPPSLIGYLVPRMARSFDAAADLVARLDAQALAEGRPVTRQLAAELLDRG